MQQCTKEQQQMKEVKTPLTIAKDLLKEEKREK
jgi:hypothetical protein